MKDRMIIIREGVVFIITVTHEQKKQQAQEAPKTKKSDEEHKELGLPDVTISAN